MVEGEEGRRGRRAGQQGFKFGSSLKQLLEEDGNQGKGHEECTASAAQCWAHVFLLAPAKR